MKRSIIKANNELCGGESMLMQWPCQLRLVPTRAPYLDGANLLVSADCAAYAYRSFHNDFMKRRVTLIGCPRLDAEAYTEKLTEIIKENDIKSITVVKMDAPCCIALEAGVNAAIAKSGKAIPYQLITVSTDGELVG